MRLFLVSLFLISAQFSWAQESPLQFKKNLIEFRSKIQDKAKSDTLINPLDTLRSREKLDSLQENLPRIDSLQRLSNKRKGVDSLGQGSENWVHHKTGELTIGLKDGIDSLSTKLKGKENSLQEKIGDRVQASEILNEDLPITNGISPKTGEQLPKLDAKPLAFNLQPLKIDDSLPTLESSVQEIKSNVDAPDLSLLNSTAKIPDSTSMTRAADSIKTIALERVKKIEPEKIEKVNILMKEVSPYEKQLDSLSWRDVKEISLTELESMPGKIKDAGIVSDEMEKFAALKAEQETLIQRYSDQKILDDEIRRKSKNVANEQLSKFSPEFNKAQRNIGKTKRVNSDVASYKDLPKKRVNEMKGKPFFERLNPGISIQPGIGSSYTVEFGLQVGYRLNGLLTWGIGGTYSAGFNRDFKYYVEGTGVHGIKTYFDLKVIKGFYVHAEVVNLKISENANLYSAETNKSKILVGHGGVGKQFEISRKLSGELIALYRIDFDRNIPALNKFSLRTVINYKLKKVRRPTDI